MSTYTLYPGCLVSRRYPGFEVAARKVAECLGIVVAGVDGFSCCPDPVWIRSSNEDLWLTLAARNLSIGEGQGDTLLTLCNGCFETLRTASILLKEGKEREKVNNYLKAVGKELKGEIEVKHMVQALYEEIGPEEIRKKVEIPLMGIKVACHPGCHYMRPSEISGVDDPVDPKVLIEMIDAIGAEVIPYQGKTLCCGLPIFQTDRELSLKLAWKKLALMEEADLIAVTCPSCFSQFETAQILRKGERNERPIPVFHYLELLALSIGVPKEELLLEVHRVPIGGILQKMGVSS